MNQASPTPAQHRASKLAELIWEPNLQINGLRINSLRTVGTLIACWVLLGCTSTPIQSTQTQNLNTKDQQWVCQPLLDQSVRQAVSPEQPSASETAEPEEIARWDCDKASRNAPLPPIVPTYRTATTQSAGVESGSNGSTAAASNSIDQDSDIPIYTQLAFQPEQPIPLIALPGDFYAVQLVAVSDLEALESYVSQYELKGLSAARVAREDEVYWALILGVYENNDIAKQALKHAPATTREFRPWVRKLSSLQAAILAADLISATDIESAAPVN